MNLVITTGLGVLNAVLAPNGKLIVYYLADDATGSPYLKLADLAGQAVVF